MVAPARRPISKHWLPPSARQSGAALLPRMPRHVSVISVIRSATRRKHKPHWALPPAPPLPTDSRRWSPHDGASEAYIGLAALPGRMHDADEAASRRGDQLGGLLRH